MIVFIPCIFSVVLSRVTFAPHRFQKYKISHTATHQLDVPHQLASSNFTIFLVQLFGVTNLTNEYAFSLISFLINPLLLSQIIITSTPL
jgi:hypothetical protein